MQANKLYYSRYVHVPRDPYESNIELLGHLIPGSATVKASYHSQRHLSNGPNCGMTATNVVNACLGQNVQPRTSCNLPYCHQLSLKNAAAIGQPQSLDLLVRLTPIRPRKN